MPEAPVIAKQIEKLDERSADVSKQIAGVGDQMQASAAARAAATDPLLKGVEQAQGDAAQFVERRQAGRPQIPDFKPQPPVDAKEFQGLSYALIGMAMIGGAVSKGNWLGVADTLNGAMKGFIDGNKALADKNVKDYEQQFKAAAAKEQQWARETEDVLKAKNLSINQKLTQIRIVAAQYDKQDMLAQGRLKSLEGVQRALDSQKTTLTGLQQRHDDNMARIRAQMEMRRQHDETIKALRGGGAGGQRPDFKTAYNVIDPAGQTALDAQAWAYIDRGALPYRKGSGGGADRNDFVMWRAGEIANSLNMSGQELAAMPAAYKADAQALAASTKKLDAVQATLESFHNNIQTWESIAKGEAPKLGGAKLRELGNDLKKIDLTDVKTLNDWKIKLETQLNDPSYVAYATAAFTVAMDYSRILSSQGQSAAQVTEGARNEAVKLVAAGYNDKARKALIGTMESDASGQIKGLETQVDRQRRRLGIRKRDSVVDDPGGGGAPGVDPKNRFPLSTPEGDRAAAEKLKSMTPEEKARRRQELLEKEKQPEKVSSASDVIDFSELAA
jgi:hypothetical protein